MYKSKKINSQNTSWGKVAKWYSGHLSKEDTYHNKVIMPNLLRLLDLQKTDTVLELGCGEGIFTREISSAAKSVTGLDLSSELIKIAKEKAKAEKKNNIDYVVASAHQSNLPNAHFDKAIIILALQNMREFNETVAELNRVLKPGGKAFLVLNHPAFRITGKSHWQFDDQKNLQYRRLDGYMTEVTNKIDMKPGTQRKTKDQYTFSFHRPLQIYFKSFQKNNLAVLRLEEWISHKKSEKGKKQIAEDTARKEFPLFMALELLKIK
jgi:ubiquinone/menaquinone biosynthesis C-methylase UbiE